MRAIDTPLDGLKIIEPVIFEDDRGFFFESFNQKDFCNAINREITFVQDNHSKSKKGVLRGLHFQTPPFAQGKLVRVIEGEAFDVAVDIRPDSKTFGRWYGLNLSEKNKLQLWIPEGFAHGFLALTETVELIYKTTNYWVNTAEKTIHWKDSDICVEWPLTEAPILSIKDQQGIRLKEIIRSTTSNS
ncbi:MULTISPECIES: dTDP-4-dehydrorhamnose 3,5-epimerase [unclassified Paludibacterium]|uniref:dTDP-4-dehydrorhamnose 3,5-epimerase n=1 Tax=unclassified Paludibacterium TaxID=2618429 RepID=UPI001C03ACE3|nr:dTDP-4-dehydrorhamnose 3,5-epimerase [Paludibacterium sp. B53371]BEV73315.1 dTDP-4-dehydrorhamnose 3,5-epimerase [Paludibacterium sp. THUN1379]